MKKAIGFAAALVVVFSLPAQARRHAPLQGQGKGLKLVANVAYAGGTDMEFITQNGRDYAITGSAPGIARATQSAMRVIDITSPEAPALVATLPCALYQMDIQISYDGRTAILGADSAGAPNSCAMVGRLGFMTVDISDVLNPKVAGFAEVAGGAHNTTAHPTQPYVYVSDGGGGALSRVDIWSIADPARPVRIGSIPGGTHDVSFNSDGSLLVTAGSRKVTVYNTSDPRSPKMVAQTTCPCFIAHDVKFTPDSKHVIAGDEAGGGAVYPCPGGALFFFRLDEDGLALVGTFEPDEVGNATGRSSPDACTSHVMDVSDDGKRLAVSWYTAGTRYLDISNMSGVSIGPLTGGVKELGWFVPVGGSSWSSKFYKGPYIYSNDIYRGFDVYRIL